MLRFAICDDEPLMRATIKKSLDTYSRLRNLDLLYDEFSCGQDFFMSKRKYDLIILDYELGAENKINGMSVARTIRSMDEDIVIIFLTSHPKVVFSSFEVDTFRFLVKPLKPVKLFHALNDFLKILDTDKSLLIRINGVTVNINTKHITFLEGNGKYCTIHTGADCFECHETLGDVQKRLPPEFFFRCHRSFVVNLNCVQSYDHEQIVLKSGVSVYVSRQKHKAFHDCFLEYTRRFGYSS